MNCEKLDGVIDGFDCVLLSAKDQCCIAVELPSGRLAFAFGATEEDAIEAVENNIVKSYNDRLERVEELEAQVAIGKLAGNTAYTKNQQAKADVIKMKLGLL